VAHEFESLDYADWLSGSLESARVVVPLVAGAVSPDSVVDVGCGIGSWLVAFQEAGVEDVLGVDGPWVDRAQLLFPGERFVQADLREPFDLERRFDLALCLEVAQILPPDGAAPLVRSLVSLADVVLFGAAIPGQGGTGHRNEQWPSYWAELFATSGYEASDPFRLRIWNEPDVKWWFAQNLVCFARPDAVASRRALAASVCHGGAPLPLVHPGCLAEANTRAATAPAEGRLSRLRRRRSEPE
jgi:SAM-dependent methyltransferase